MPLYWHHCECIVNKVLLLVFRASVFLLIGSINFPLLLLHIKGVSLREQRVACEVVAGNNVFVTVVCTESKCISAVIFCTDHWIIFNFCKGAAATVSCYIQSCRQQAAHFQHNLLLLSKTIHTTKPNQSCRYFFIRITQRLFGCTVNTQTSCSSVVFQVN